VAQNTRATKSAAKSASGAATKAAKSATKSATKTAKKAASKSTAKKAAKTVTSRTGSTAAAKKTAARKTAVATASPALPETVTPAAPTETLVEEAPHAVVETEIAQAEDTTSPRPRTRGAKRNRLAPSERKLFVLDTNVLLHDSNCLFKFEEHDIYLPMIVLEELDNHKKGMSEVARNARQVSRFLDTLVNESEDLEKGVNLDALGNQEALG